MQTYDDDDDCGGLQTITNTVTTYSTFAKLPKACQVAYCFCILHHMVLYHQVPSYDV